MVDLTGKHAVVTGGGSGAGAAIAVALADAGAVVTVMGRRMEPLMALADQHANIHCQAADVTDMDSLFAAFDAASADHGPAGIVIANAGAAESAPFHRMDMELWNRMLSVNLTGTYLTAQAGYEDMKGLGWGRIIAIASTAGLRGYPYVSGYSAAKHGVVGLVKSLALEAAKTGITVNAVCPGFMETPMLDESIRNIMEKTGRSEEEARKSLVKDNPQGRFIQVQEVADMVLWLCGEGAASVTGQALSLSGGEI
ncbi:NAD(P)-dependent dehydrogenase (short-subunit alcohol dehydrogenase family) [Aestuariispira insulae]|uniref:NAD(P)-dependent dehydrogenase (Short-subunit alcohol dehydrogenase family) n=2 Tax=Aestuariispira insulae TaxID=1461337 RepID=A0A3D9HHQ9_9PROT|nr:SDR family NAD(P)-dependent oxidoreductase [Aestuariispira insulae]RED49072.1 NAD(P)-dependent dehydrogenase (short-subunit alcohol dehydrogenase family) [Aestuariispira insulae]